MLKLFFPHINPPPPSDAVRKQKKTYFRGSFRFNIVKIKKKYHLSENPKFINFGIFQSMKFRILLKNLSYFS